MALRCISQVALDAETETALVTGQVQPLSIKSILICNRGVEIPTYRLRLSRQDETSANKQYLYYDVVINPATTHEKTVPIGLLPGDILYGYASTDDLSFNIFAE